MRISIIGAGAMGCLFGGKLSSSGNEVILMDCDKELVETINANGLIIDEKDPISGVQISNEYKSSITASTSYNAFEVGKVDLVIIFVKSINTRSAILENIEIFQPGTSVLSLQNGLGNVQTLTDFTKGINIIAGTTSHGATLVGKGHIFHAGDGKTIIGDLNGTISNKLEEIREIFEKAGIDTEISTNIEGAIWDKLLVNVGINALSGICNIRNGEIGSNEHLRELMAMAVHEAWEIALKKEILLNYANPIEHTLEVCRSTSENTSSMLQDLMNSRKTEIEAINGAIVSEGVKYKINTKVNETLTRLVQFKESENERIRTGSK